MCIDAIPYLDDNDVDRVVNVIESMIVGGVNVLLPLQPSTEFMVDQLSCSTIITASDLCISEHELLTWGMSDSGNSLYTVVRLTHGIPALCRTLHGAKESDFGFTGGPQ